MSRRRLDGVVETVQISEGDLEPGSLAFVATPSSLIYQARAQKGQLFCFRPACGEGHSHTVSRAHGDVFMSDDATTIPTRVRGCPQTWHFTYSVPQRTTYPLLGNWEPGLRGQESRETRSTRRGKPPRPPSSDPEDAHCLWLIAYSDTPIRQACEPAISPKTTAVLFLVQPANLRQGRGYGKSNAELTAMHAE